MPCCQRRWASGRGQAPSLLTVLQIHTAHAAPCQPDAHIGVVVPFLSPRQQQPGRRCHALTARPVGWAEGSFPVLQKGPCSHVMWGQSRNTGRKKTVVTAVMKLTLIQTDVWARSGLLLVIMPEIVVLSCGHAVPFAGVSSVTPYKNSDLFLPFHC